MMGNKVAARDLCIAHHFPLAPSVASAKDEHSFIESIGQIGLPVLIKAAAGGGGKGMQIIKDMSGLEQAVQLAKGEALRSFKNSEVYAERYIEKSRHIEVQVLADHYGNVIHLQSGLFADRHMAGRMFRNQCVLSAMGVKQVALVLGHSTAGGAYIPTLCDYSITVRKTGGVFLGGPPLVKAATGEEVTADELGGADVHSSVSGTADYAVDSEPEGIALLREIVGAFPREPKVAIEQREIEEPYYDPKELYGIIPDDVKKQFDIREVIARIVYGSRFHEFKSAYGSTLVCGFAFLYGWKVGQINGGINVMMTGLDTERVAVAGLAPGIGETTLEIALKYTKSRKQFNRPISEFQMVKAKLANIYTEIEAARGLVYRAARLAGVSERGGKGTQIHKLAAAAILFTGEAVSRATDICLQLHGGYGYATEYPINRFYRDAKLYEIGAGTSDIRRLVVADELIKKGTGYL
ncbi:MAG: ATP-grasp domain-containing protein [Desulfatitalea sp.]|nr:ATP-grasp domain-containing protein [Desulfatitalea sp.]NNK01131.1 ATP-grasp domain-containing protein [Desulfatitalea sp.]